MENKMPKLWNFKCRWLWNLFYRLQNVKRVNVEGRFDALLNYFLETFDEFLIANYDEELRMEEISEVS